MKANTKDTIKSLYMYIVLLAGLFMMVIPAIDLVKMGLETWVFPLASQDEYNYRYYAPEPYMVKDRIVNETSATEVGDLKLTEDEKLALERWKTQFEEWEEKDKNKDHVAIQRQRNIVRDISVLLGGIVLFFSHGYALRKSKKA